VILVRSLNFFYWHILVFCSCIKKEQNKMRNKLNRFTQILYIFAV